jgi:flavin-dependent dehydrogenase
VGAATGNDEPRVDVAVVGAGVTGLSIAWHLRKTCAEVLVLERRHPLPSFRSSTTSPIPGRFVEGRLVREQQVV